jgi:hypothetical protein
MDAIFTSYGRIHGATVNKKGSAIPIADSSETTVATAYTFRFPIHFWEDWRPGVGWREGMCWPTVFTNGYRLPSVQVEVPLNSASGVTDKKTTLHDFEAFVEVDDVLGKVDKDGKPIFNITKIERMIQPYAAAAAFPLTTLDRRDVIQQISIFTGYTAARDADGTVSWVSNDPISKVRFAMNDVVLYDDITKTRNDEHNRKFGMNLADPATSVYAAPASWAVNAAGGCGIPLADRFDLIFEDTDNPFDALPAFAAQSMVLTPTMGSAEATRKTFTMLIARYGSGLPY